MADEAALVALSLGGNLGDAAGAMERALARLAQAGVVIIAVSSLYRTAPWGELDQPDFLNRAALARTRLSPRALLALTQSLEREGGRAPGERWGPRALDIDILTYDDRVIAEPDLVVPHPRLAERAFVLTPLAEIAPDLVIAGESVAALSRACGSEGVLRVGL